MHDYSLPAVKKVSSFGVQSEREDLNGYEKKEEQC
jgi:hypothetical protein